jgi:hypothetical protein
MARSTADRIAEISRFEALSLVENSPPFGFLRGTMIVVPRYPRSPMIE